MLIVSKKYTQQDLDQVLDKIKQGPIGQKKDWQWEQSINMLGDHRNKGKKLTNAHIEKIANTKRGKSLTEEHKRKQSITNKTRGIKPNELAKENARKAKFKPVVATCIVTGKIFNFHSSKQAAKELKLNSTNISSVLRKRQNSTGGYTFKYAKNDKVR